MNFVNEVVLFVVCCNKNIVDMYDFEDVKDKLYMGFECKLMVICEEECCVIVYYEVGYVIVVEIL